MAYVQTIPPAGADGPLRAIYDAALARAGRVFQILQVQSLNAASLQASLQLYLRTTTDPRNSLPRWVREAIATAVSRANDCFY